MGESRRMILIEPNGAGGRVGRPPGLGSPVLTNNSSRYTILGITRNWRNIGNLL